jgi:hypothetical protein
MIPSSRFFLKFVFSCLLLWRFYSLVINNVFIYPVKSYRISSHVGNSCLSFCIVMSITEMDGQKKYLKASLFCRDFILLLIIIHPCLVFANVGVV